MRPEVSATHTASCCSTTNPKPVSLGGSLRARSPFGEAGAPWLDDSALMLLLPRCNAAPPPPHTHTAYPTLLSSKTAGMV